MAHPANDFGAVPEHEKQRKNQNEKVHKKSEQVFDQGPQSRRQNAANFSPPLRSGCEKSAACHLRGSWWRIQSTACKGKAFCGSFSTLSSPAVASMACRVV